MDANRAICVPLGTSKSRKMKGGWTGDLIDCTTSNHLVQDVSQHFVQADNSQQDADGMHPWLSLGFGHTTNQHPEPRNVLAAERTLNKLEAYDYDDSADYVLSVDDVDVYSATGEGPAVAAGEPAGVGEYPASYAPAPSEELLDVPEGNGRMLSSDERDDSELYFDTDAYYFDEDLP